MIIHIWNLPEKRNYIILKERLKDKLIKILENKKYPWKIRNKIRNGKISIKKLKQIYKKEKIPLQILEKNIRWIGGNCSKGLSKPKIPFNLSSREGARFIAAIINDGTLTKNGENDYGRLMYDNFDKFIRESVIKDYLIVFGGKPEEISFRDYKRKKYLEFSSVIRDMVELVLKNKGAKCETNLSIPKFIFKNKENMLGWVEQTIADEGEVKNYLYEYRRSIVWRRSIDVSDLINWKIKKDIPLRGLPLRLQKLIQNKKCELIEGEKKILEKLGIDYSLYNLGVYSTSKNKIRTRWQINITKRENLIKLRKLIRIPSKEKDVKFTKALKDYVRYKEPLKIKEVIITICKKKNKINSNDLQKAMDYKRINNAYTWLKRFEKEGLIKMIKKSEYGYKGKQRSSAEYTLIRDI